MSATGNVEDMLQEAFVWRRACKRFKKPEVPIDIQPVLDAIVAAPTCFGTAPFKVYVVSDSELQEKISPVAFNQPQITDASYLLFFVASTDSPGMADRYIAANKLDEYNPAYAGMIRGMTGSYDEAAMAAWARAQSYIAMGYALCTLGLLKIPSCPMEGINGEEVGKLIGVSASEKVYSVIAIGGATDDPVTANPYPRFRFPSDEIIKRI
mmetsp:Transcript_5632/g.5831  ORF Transcript_5632/g.5831 Transcript_5632/m.5831 type:complete len:210 (+) Transcript_5632:67-696(+)|eukprot:CAMPEP_0182425204 /NCGR_PEP_ID=MMETSP1167-20130531/11554_1 /TAXON_ID=2988 /ORGANISM="Mallomonas Sp, Strain CCMP3275" /LENGTH=209 /DNA_ID=CAMNT_0024605663 /DNA_START=61 /DNA_END=690 /DNA_ORIENTATION=-